MAVAVVALALVVESFLPVVVGGHPVGFASCTGRTLVGSRFGVVGSTHSSAGLVAKVNVAGQGTEIVHNVVDAKVVAMHGIFTGVSANVRFLLVERHLAYTVDGVVGVVNLLRHTILGTLHHHATTPHTAEVGTLDGVHQAAGIDGEHTALLPIGVSIIGIRYPLTPGRIIYKNSRSCIICDGNHDWCLSALHINYIALFVFLFCDKQAL